MSPGLKFVSEFYCLNSSPVVNFLLFDFGVVLDVLVVVLTGV